MPAMCSLNDARLSTVLAAQGVCTPAPAPVMMQWMMSSADVGQAPDAPVPAVAPAVPIPYSTAELECMREAADVMVAATQPEPPQSQHQRIESLRTYLEAKCVPVVSTSQLGLHQP